MMLVTGATGTVGSELVARLAERGETVRAMTRRPKEIQVPPGVEAVYGDAEDPESLNAAFRGVDAAFLMSAQPVGAAPRPTHDLALVDAAARAGVERIAKLSVYDAGEGGTDPLSVWHAEAEAAVTGSGLAYTLLRPGRFMTNTLGWAPMIARGDTVYAPFAHLPSASIDPADVADVAAVALTTGAHDGAAYRLTGPEALTPAGELAVIAEAIGRPLRIVEPPEESFRTGMRRTGMSEDVIDTIVTRMRDDPPRAEVLPTVEQVLRRAPTPFAAWVRRNREAFTPPSGR